MEALLKDFGMAVDNEIITITISPPKDRVAILKITNNVLKSSITYSIGIYDQIGWYQIANKLKEIEWL